MSKFDAGMWLGIIGGLTLFLLWIYGLFPDAPKVMRIVSQVVLYMAVAALISFVVYCILILIG